LGLSVLGGLLLSQLLTLYTTPVVFVGLERLRQRVLGPRVWSPNSTPAAQWSPT
jgi:multidrug efflux pump